MKTVKTPKPKAEIMWAIYGSCGLYVGASYTRRDAKKNHMSALGRTDWKECTKNGDRAIKVRVIPV